MREIKFRGKALSDDKWLYGNLNVNDDGKAAIMRIGDFWSLQCVAPDTVGQFTGLYDCEGREIYEGDVVERDNSYFQKTCPTLSKTTVGIVKWCDGEFIVTGSYKLFSSSDKFPIRVIGNVHDNPNLLEAAHDQSD